MAHNTTTGRIYRPTSGGTTYGISTKDVRTILGVTEHNLGGLNIDSHINPDALFKPYDGSGINDTFLQGGPDGLYGYNIPNTQGHLTDIYRQRWSFNTPSQRGLLLGAFENYNHLVSYNENPWGLTVVDSGTSLYCSFSWGGPAEFVCPKNMAIFQSCYMGVAIYAGSSFRYAVTHNDTIGNSTGCLITILKNDVNLVPDTVGEAVVLIPFIIGSQIAATTNIADIIGQTKWNINFRSFQHYTISGSEVLRDFTFSFESTAIRESGYTILLTVYVTNNGSTAQSTAFYPLWKAYQLVTAGGTTYKDLLMDRSDYHSSDGSTPSTSTSSIAAGATQTYTIRITTAAEGVNTSDIDVLDLRIYSPSHSGCSTIFREVTLVNP